MKTFFQIVKEVLDQGYSQIPLKDRDKSILEAKEGLSTAYMKILKKNNIIYDDPAVRFAYIYTYTSAHAEMLNRLITNSKTLMGILSSDRVVISCFGGGPGSDVLGFVKYLLSQDKRPKLKFFIVDKEPAWAESWSDLEEILEGDLESSKDWRTVDIADITTKSAFAKPYTADIFTMIFFLSEIYSDRENTEAGIRSVFDKCKSGACIAVIDFDRPELQNWIDSIAKKNNCERVIVEDVDFQMPFEEESKDLKEYREKFGYPKLKGDCFYRLFRKK